MEELMSVVKILLPAAVIATTMGSVVAYSYVYRSLSIALIAASEEDLVRPPQSAKDDALKGDPSWARRPSLTDY
jgi:hypothetical protein